MNEDEVRDWLEVASHDADTVRLLIRENGHPDIIIYHIHQAVEKLLKTMILRCNAPFEKSHRLDKLLNHAISFYPDLMSIKDAVLEIDYYMPKLRYPAGERIEFETAERLYEVYNDIEKLLLKYAQGI